MSSPRGQDPLHNRDRPIAQVRCRRHSWRHANEAVCGYHTRPFLGYADTEGARISDHAAAQSRTDNSAAQTGYLLPKDLAGALKRLDDAEVDTLLAAVTSEAERRGRLPKPPASRATTLENAGASLTTGKLNAIRAAFKAGVKPSAIGRQFGISLSDVRKALATAGRDGKSR